MCAVPAGFIRTPTRPFLSQAFPPSPCGPGGAFYPGFHAASNCGGSDHLGATGRSSVLHDICRSGTCIPFCMGGFPSDITVDRGPQGGSQLWSALTRSLATHDGGPYDGVPFTCVNVFTGYLRLCAGRR